MRVDLGLLVGARGREAQQRQAVAVEVAILHPVAFGLAGSLFVELVAVGLDSQDGPLAYAVVDQEVEVCGTVRGIAALLVVEKRPVADQLSQRLGLEVYQQRSTEPVLSSPSMIIRFSRGSYILNSGRSRYFSFLPQEKALSTVAPNSIYSR